MTLTEQLTDYVNAAFTGLWVLTHEPDEAEREIVEHARGQRWRVASWDGARGGRGSARAPRRAPRRRRGRGGAAGRPAGAARPGRPRRHVPADPAQLPPL